VAVVVGAGVGLGGEGEVVEVVLVLAHVIDVLDVPWGTGRACSWRFSSDGQWFF